MTMTEQARDIQLEIFKDERRYAGIELRKLDPKHCDPQEPVRLTLFDNTYGGFEASYTLSRDEIEEIHDWLTNFLDHKM